MLNCEKVSGHIEQENLIEVFENGTDLGTVLPNIICESTVIDIPSEVLSNSISKSDVRKIDNSESSVSDVHENTSMLEKNDTTDSTQIEFLNVSTNCSRTTNHKKRARRKLKEYYNTNIFANPFPPSYNTVYVDPLRQSAVQPIGFPNSSLDTDNVSLNLPNNQRSLTTTSGRRLKRFCTSPSVPVVVGILALAGVTCTLGGIGFGSTGLLEHSTQYLSAALLMIGIGVTLLVISGAIWRLSIPDESDASCFNSNYEVCQNCNSPYCSNRFITTPQAYPEFQHRPPPPSYFANIDDYVNAIRIFNPGTPISVRSMDSNVSPPPSYRAYGASSLSLSTNPCNSSFVEQVVAENISNCIVDS